MAYTYEDLSAKKVADLREIAKDLDHEALRGYTTMHKTQLLAGLCRALGIEAHEHHDVVGVDKSAIKARIRELKVARQTALEARDAAELRRVRRQIHRLKRRLRGATV